MNLNLHKSRPFKYDFLVALFTAFAFSAFIYFAYFSLSCTLCNTITALLALTSLLYSSKRAVLLSGFFIGLLWFYWIGYSFNYYNLHWMQPFVSLGFGVIYMLFFGVLALTNKPYIRALMLFALSFFAPFDFNWMRIELLFVDSYFSIHAYDLAIILLALVLAGIGKSPYRYLWLLLLFAALAWPQTTKKMPPMPNIKIDLVTTTLPQNQKWKPQNRQEIIRSNIAQIKKAIAQGYDLVVLPESAFPMYLNLHPDLMAYLAKLSHQITIITGSLLYQDNKEYNVAFMFQDGNYKIAKKMVLVPFGEYIPLPKFAQKWINKIFFDGASDFTHATHPTDFKIKGIKFRNAICYEATTDPIYQGDPKYVIAISNNGWFTPSIEPTLQRLLMRYYAKKYHTIIFHAANIAKSGIVR